MRQLNAFTTIAQRAAAEIVEKKSRFIAHIAPVSTEDETRIFLEEVRMAHRMARHNVYAYTLRDGGRVRYSDDGEPAQTAGLPCLQVLQHAELVDVIVVVTRYFGGTLLGTGGLVRAYTQATQAAIEKASIAQISVCIDFEVKIPYSLYDQLVYMSQQIGAKISEPEFSETVSLKVRVLEEDAEKARLQLQELTRDQVEICESKPYNARF